MSASLKRWSCSSFGWQQGDPLLLVSVCMVFKLSWTLVDWVCATFSKRWGDFYREYSERRSASCICKQTQSFWCSSSKSTSRCYWGLKTRSSWMLAEKKGHGFPKVVKGGRCDPRMLNEEIPTEHAADSLTDALNWKSWIDDYMRRLDFQQRERGRYYYYYY